MAKSMKENGSIIKQMGKEFTYIQTALNIKDNGKMIGSTGSASRLGPTANHFKDNLIGEPNLEKEF
jgi:hypothetical protein